MFFNFKKTAAQPVNWGTCDSKASSNQAQAWCHPSDAKTFADVNQAQAWCHPSDAKTFTDVKN